MFNTSFVVAGLLVSFAGFIAAADERPSRNGQNEATMNHDAFLEQFAKTNRFRLGEPGAFKVTPDGNYVLFLRSEGPESFAQELWIFDVATGTERRLLNAADLLGKGDEKLTAEELARRERMRMSSRGIASFEISKDGKALLVPLSGRLFRVLMTTAESGKVHATEVSTGGSAIDPRLSPDGNRVAFARDGAVWMSPLAGGDPRRISPEAKGDVSYGEAEFAAQEEMKRMHGLWWSPDSRRIAYQRSDVSALETFYIPDPADPAKQPQAWKYPRAGKANADVSLWISPDIGADGGTPVEVKWDSKAFPYLARVDWPKHGAMTILVQNRAQTEQVLYEVNTATGALRPLLTEKDNAWIGLEHDIPAWLSDGRRFLWLSEQGDTDGWELQIYSADGVLQKRIAPKGWEIEGLIDVGDKGEVALLSAVPTGDSSQMQVLRVDLKTGNATCISDPPDRSGGASAGGQFGVATNDAMTTWVLSGRKRDGTGVVEVWKGKPGLEDGTLVGQIGSVSAQPSIVPKPEWVRVKAGGREYAAVILRPRNFDPKKKYPVIDFVYGGPGANQVNANARSYLLQQWFADQGFIVVSIDGRGTPRRGREWARVLKQNGEGNFIDAPLGDQCEALEALCKKFPEMDRSRIGVFGWSFGGYFSSMATMRRPDIFKAGVSGAPVTDWRDYDTHYTERYMGLPDQNKGGYDASDVLTYAKDLTVPLLVIQGTADDNVYFVHSLKLTDRLFREGKQFEFIPLASQTHMVTKPEMVLRLYERIAEFFERTLGEPK